MRRRGWFKCWSEKLSGSPRIRALKPWEYGVYMHLLVASDDQGALLSGSHVWTIQDLCLECNARGATKRMEKAMDRFITEGLVKIRAADGAWIVANFSQLQKPGPSPAKKRPRMVIGQGRPEAKGPVSFRRALGG